jgi:hypothetical protein
LESCIFSLILYEERGRDNNNEVDEYSLPFMKLGLNVISSHISLIVRQREKKQQNKEKNLNDFVFPIFCIELNWSGVEWSGVEWSGVEWSGVEWSGVKWSEVE